MNSSICRIRDRVQNETLQMPYTHHTHMEICRRNRGKQGAAARMMSEGRKKDTM